MVKYLASMLNSWRAVSTVSASAAMLVPSSSPGRGEGEYRFGVSRDQKADFE